MRNAFAVASFVLLAACGGSAPAPTAPAVPATAPTSDGPSEKWADATTNEAKVAFMKTRVLPRMSEVMKAHDPTRYASVTCKTCHGPDNKEPKDFLPKLAMKDGKLAAFSTKPEVAKFMAEKIVPEMASAMGVAPYNPETHQGFGCGGCHAIQN